MTLRKCQQDALDVIKEHQEQTINLSLCTGAGKTKLIQLIPEVLQAKRIIIVFPWLALLQQFWKDKNN